MLIGSFHIPILRGLLDPRAIAHLDSTGAAALDAVHGDLSGRDITFGVAQLNCEAMGLLERAGVIDHIGAGRFFDDRKGGPLAFHQQERRDRMVGGEGHELKESSAPQGEK